MQTMQAMREKTVRVRLFGLDDAVFVAFAGIVIGAIVAWSVAVYQSRYADKNIDGGASTTITYQAASGSSKTTTMTLEPAAGSLYFGAAQTSGTSSARYTVKYKKTSTGTYTTVVSGMSFSKNNVYRPEKLITAVNGSTDYNIAISKTANLSTKSVLAFDWMLR